MPEEKDILKEFEKLKSNEHFKVPDGYFDNLPGQIMDKIKASEEKPEQPGLWVTIRPQLALAASFVALFMLAYTGFKLFLPEKSANTLSESEIVATLENEIYDLDESYMIDLIETDNKEPVIDNARLTKEEIMDYLMEEGDDLDLSLTEL